MSFDDVTYFSGLGGLVLFVVFFSLMLVWVFRPGSKRIYEQDALIPLRDEPPTAAHKEG